MLRYTHFILAILLILSIGALSYFGQLKKFDHQLLDSTHKFLKSPNNDDVVVIEIDERSLAKLGAWPWSRAYHADLIKVLNESNSSVIVFDILFSESNEHHYEGDIALAEQIESHNNVFLPIAIQSIQTGGPLIEITPTPLLYQASPNLGHVHIHCDDDAICRSVFLEEGLGERTWPHITWAALNEKSKSIPPPGGKIPHVKMKQQRFIYRDFHNYIPFSTHHYPFRRVSYSDVLEGTFHEDIFENKTVFVGVTAAGLGDQIATPIGLIPGVFFHAFTYQALNEKTVIGYPREELSLLFFAVISLTSIIFLVKLSPLNFLISSVAFVALAYIVMVLCLSALKTWIPIANFMLVIMVFYPIWSWFKLQIALIFLKNRLKVLSKKNLNLFSLSDNSKNSPKDFKKNNFYDVDIVTKTLSQLKKAGQTIDQQQNFIQHTLAQLSEAVVLTDNNGKIILCNPIAEELIGIQPSQKIQDLEFTTITKGGDWKAIIDKIIYDEIFITVEISRKFSGTKNSVELYCQARKTQLTTSKTSPSTILLFTFTDISSLKKAEQSRLDTLNFLSHDLRSPMVSILALIENIESGKSKKSLPGILDDIRKYTEKNLRYSENILLLSKADSIDSGTFEPIDMHFIIDSAYYDTNEIASSKDIKISIERTANACLVLGEASLLERALINLLSNAIKYCPPHTEIYISVLEQEGYVDISVRDTGPGIEPSKLEHIFGKFVRNTHNKQKVGAGLGLYFVKKVSEKHSGNVNVRSILGKGTTFCISLPLIS